MTKKEGYGFPCAVFPVPLFLGFLLVLQDSEDASLLTYPMQLSLLRCVDQSTSCDVFLLQQTDSSKGVEGLKEAMCADASVAVRLLAKAEQCATDVLARLGQSHSMARLLEGQAASVAAQLPEMQASPACPHLVPCCHADPEHDMLGKWLLSAC